MSVRNRRCSLRSNPEGRSSQPPRGGSLRSRTVLMLPRIIRLGFPSGTFVSCLTNFFFTNLLPLSRVLHAFPSYAAWFNPNNVGRSVQFASLLFLSFCHFRLCPDVLLSILFPNTLDVFLSFPHAFCRLFNYTHQHARTHARTHARAHTHTHTHTHIYIYNLRSLKFTVKHLKRSYMFRSHEHPQVAYIVPSLNYNFSKEQCMHPEDDRVIETCRSVLNVLM